MQPPECPTVTIDRSTPSRRPVTWSDVGACGHIEPSGGRRTAWTAVTPGGLESPPFTTQNDAAHWLRFQARPSLREPAAAPPDPVLQRIAHLVDQGATSAAESVVIAMIAEDIRDMRSARWRHQPPALWAHLERYESWFAALYQQPATTTADGRPARVVDILTAVTRR